MCKPGKRIRLGGGVESDVGGVVGADEEIAAGGFEAIGGVAQICVDLGQIVGVPQRDGRAHRQNGECDLGMLVLAQASRALADHFEITERGAVG